MDQEYRKGIVRSVPWYRRVRRWGHSILIEDDPARNIIDFWWKQWKRTEIQGVIVNCEGLFCNTFCYTSEDNQNKANNEQKKSPVFTGFQSLNTGKEKVEKKWE